MREEEIREILSKNIKYYRDKKGLSQMALALKAGLATNFINDIENGKKWVSPSTLSKIVVADVKLPKNAGEKFPLLGI